MATAFHSKTVGSIISQCFCSSSSSSSSSSGLATQGRKGGQLTNVFKPRILHNHAPRKRLAIVDELLERAVQKADRGHVDGPKGGVALAGTGVVGDDVEAVLVLAARVFDARLEVVARWGDDGSVRCGQVGCGGSGDDGRVGGGGGGVDGWYGEGESGREGEEEEGEGL